MAAPQFLFWGTWRHQGALFLLAPRRAQLHSGRLLIPVTVKSTPVVSHDLDQAPASASSPAPAQHLFNKGILEMNNIRIRRLSELLGASL